MSGSKKRAWHFLSLSGKFSRRAEAQKLLAEGRIQLDHRPLSSLDRFVNLKKSLLTVDGNIVKPLKKKIYLMHHKPLGIVSSKSSKGNQPSILHSLNHFSSLTETERKTLFVVGRLDLNSSGLIFLTNDGPWAHNILSPDADIPKIYHVTLDQEISNRETQLLEKGLTIELEKNGAIRFYQTKPCKIKPIHSIAIPQQKTDKTQSRTFRITLHEGKKRQIRRMFLTLGRKVTHLHRTSIGSVQLGDLPVGDFRFLSAQEIQSLEKRVLFVKIQ
jgi:pseudouridine synthase